MSCRSASQTSLFAILLLITGCEPRYSYHPVTATGGTESRFRDKIGDVKFSMEPYDTTTGAKSILQSLFIDNGSTTEVVVLGAELETGGKTFPAKIYRDAEGEKERIVPPKFSKSVSLAFAFSASASEVLNQDITWVWHLGIGDEEHTLHVPMRRN